MEIIELRNLSKTYNPNTIPVRAVNKVNLTFKEGEFTAIVGASGSGKTTLLNMIGGIDDPTDGEVWIASYNLNQMGETQKTRFRRDHIGFVFQSHNLLPVLTARENVEFIMEMQGKPAKERHARSKELLISIGLGERLHSRPGALSGGQQQRVAVARALAHKPKFVIADEPTANLDSKSTADLLDIMVKLNEEEGITFLFSTHDQRVVERAKRVIVFEDGRVKKDHTK